MKRFMLAAVLSLNTMSIAAQSTPPRFESMGLGCCTLRVRSVDGSAEGKYQGMPAPSRIVLSPCKGGLCPKVGSGDSTIGVSPNVRVDMYAGRSTGKGLVWGAVIGAVAITAIWLGDQDLEQSTAGKIAAGIPLGAVAGGVAGALVGALFPRWIPVAR
jgi:hypothetical protein